MSLDKAIASGQERRRKHRGTKANDRTCRNHGTCDACRDSRLYRNKKRLMAAEEQEREFYDGPESVARG